MNSDKYKFILYFITATIVVTLAIQVYWNLKNYEVNKQRLVNDVQIALDNGVEVYYSDLIKSDVRSMVTINTTDTVNVSGRFEMDFGWKVDSLHQKGLLRRPPDPKTLDSMITSWRGATKNIRQLNVISREPDSLVPFRSLTNKIFISFFMDSINFDRLDSALQKELQRKSLDIAYGLKHYSRFRDTDSFHIESSKKKQLHTFSKSSYLKDGERIELIFDNPILLILKRSLGGIFVSLLLAASIIACLLYLLDIIKKQKQLSDIKNDLISNITHEFKTPITTIGTAIEGMKNFNVEGNPEKNSRYLDISETQLKKLHLMVEKLLETATLDSDKLIINKEPVELVVMLQNLTDRFRLVDAGKTITFITSVPELYLEVDPFHFENAIANLVDNAIKYGGPQIEVRLNKILNGTEITVADNGNGIDKSQKDRIFDKFYRIPTGNVHDVKGFGIGLFYSKNIIEKHGGSLQLISGKTTLFMIIL